MNELVERCELAPGFTISRILTGLWQIADMERDGHSLDLKAAADAMAPYVEAGFTTFDMADHYGSAEKIAGLFQKENGPRIQLLTKWVPTPGPVTREEIRSAVQRSLDRMQATRLDLLQFHTWNYADPVWWDCLYWLQELKQEGLICQLGLTNVDTTHLRIVINSGIEVVSNQVCFSLLDQRAKKGMTELCLQNGIKLLAFGTVAGGFLTEHWLGKPEPSLDELVTWSQMKYKRFIDAAGGWMVFQELLHKVDQIAQRLGASMANVACRYILEEPAVGGIIIGARLGQSDHIQNNLRVFQFSLDELSRSKIGDMLARLKPIPGDCGDEYRRPPFLTASGDLSHHVESFPLPYEPQSSEGGHTVVLSGKGRAVRRENHISISATDATYGDRVIGGKDPVAQYHFVVDKIEGALFSLGGRLEDIVCTTVNIRDAADTGAVAGAHEERFRGIRTAHTLTQAKLEGEACLVEIQAEAVVKKPDR
ncbi:MAG: aldo/keto reductase [Candidatus Aminicenantes bacterium]|nr:MAG: aldo/keto reductase [Candidatus Aminicenantes bacterium]